MDRLRFFLFGLLVVLGLAACSHAPPHLIQVFSQVNRVYDPASQTWTARLSVFAQGASNDGTKVFDRIHLIHDEQDLYFTLTQDQWTAVNRPGEFWVGSNGLQFPGGEVPTGTWRAVLVTRSGQKVESTFAIPPQAPEAPPVRTGKVTVRADGLNRFQVGGWVEDYMVWSLDGRGTILSRNKTVGPQLVVSGAATSFYLYSYDKNRGEGLLAGPFPVQGRSESADR